VRWLRAIGADDSCVFLHVSPTPSSKVAVDQLAFPFVRDAKYDSIWGSINELSARSGTKLFVILSGHGLYDPATGRLFLTQDYGVHNDWDKNLGLEGFLKYFRSLSFAEQYVFFDGCQNYPSPLTQRAEVSARNPPIANYTPRAENGLVACFAASQGQQALEIGGRSAMLRRLLEALDPVTLVTMPPYDMRQNAVVYEWTTGEQWIDLRRLFYDVVRDQVTQDAARIGHQQTPQLEPYGKSATEARSLVMPLEMQPTSVLVVDIAPPEVTTAIAQIRIRMRMPFRERSLPIPPNTLTLPDRGRVPKHTEIESFCFTNPGVPWTLKEWPKTIAIEDPEYNLVFQFEHLPPQAIGQVPPHLGNFNIRIVDLRNRSPLVIPTGQVQRLVGDLTRRLPLDVQSSITTTWLPDGIDLAIAPEERPTGAKFAGEYARAVARIMHERGLQVVIAPPGRSIAECLPNVTFEMPIGGPAGLAGYLGEANLIAIDYADTPVRTDVGLGGGDYSLSYLADLRALRLEPGPNRVSLDLPWGSWTEFVAVPDEGIATCAFPDSVGVMPLRHMPSARFAGSGRSHEIKPRQPDGRKPGQMVLERYFVFAWFPDIRFRTHIRGGLACVEPYSETPHPEWDLLVATGRLEALPAFFVGELCSGHGNWPATEAERGIFGLAVAYAAYAVRSLGDLLRVLHRLPWHAGQTLDARLLTLEAIQLTEGVVQPKAKEAVAKDLHDGQFPVFRWGMPIAMRYSANEEMPLISPASVWTTLVMDMHRER
jgi:hypothetical protein